jgi:hypothetical protein
MSKPQVARGSSRGELICNLAAISPNDRLHYRDLRLQLRTAHISSKAVNNGYAVRLSEERMSMEDVSVWIRLEGLCCPWLSLRAERVEQGSLEVRMEAPDRAKHVLRMELEELLPNDLLK